MRQKIGFIGAGAMGSAILKGILAKDVVQKEDITVAEVHAPTREKIARETGVRVSATAADAVLGMDVTVVAVKPHVLAKVMASVKGQLRAGQLLMSIAAGVTLESLQGTTEGTGARWVRVMPNIACTVGESASTFVMGAACTEVDVRTTQTVLSACGMSLQLPEERLLDGATGVAGSGIAYVFLFIEALADGGVRAGLPRPAALTLAIQTVLGGAKLAMSTGTHPGQLKDMVCSPGGTTIEAVATLERLGLRPAVIEAVTAAYQKAVSLGLKAKEAQRAKL